MSILAQGQKKSIKYVLVFNIPIFCYNARTKLPYCQKILTGGADDLPVLFYARYGEDKNRETP